MCSSHFLFLRPIATRRLLRITIEIYNFQILLNIEYGVFIARNNNGSLLHYYPNPTFRFAFPAPLLSLPQAVYLIASSPPVFSTSVARLPCGGFPNRGLALMSLG